MIPDSTWYLLLMLLGNMLSGVVQISFYLSWRTSESEHDWMLSMPPLLRVSNSFPLVASPYPSRSWVLCAVLGVFHRFQYEASFVYDLMEWVHPGTIHEYAQADQRHSPPATTVANAGVSSSLKTGPLEDEG